MQSQVHWVSDAIQPSHPLLSPSPPAPNLSQHQGLFQWVSSLHQIAKMLESQLEHQSFWWISGLISFRMDWLDLLAVQGTLKNLLQHQSINSSALSFLYNPTLISIHDYWKNYSIDKRTLVGKVMSLLINILSRLVIAFLPRAKYLLISWLQSPSAVILELQKIQSLTVSFVYPSICQEMMGPDAMMLVLWMLSFKPTFHSPLTFSSRGSLVLHFLP